MNNFTDSSCLGLVFCTGLFRGTQRGRGLSKMISLLRTYPPPPPPIRTRNRETMLYDAIAECWRNCSPNKAMHEFLTLALSRCGTFSGRACPDLALSSDPHEYYSFVIGWTKAPWGWNNNRQQGRSRVDILRKRGNLFAMSFCVDRVVQ